MLRQQQKWHWLAASSTQQTRLCPLCCSFIRLQSGVLGALCLVRYHAFFSASHQPDQLHADYVYALPLRLQLIQRTRAQ
jgi:hypothetical protein